MSEYADAPVIGMPTEVWGPRFWFVLHTVSFAYPDTPGYQHKKYAYDFYNAIQAVIPCPLCRDHYAQEMRNLPLTPYLDSRAKLMEWVWRIHNAANRRLNKPEYSFHDMVRYYMAMVDDEMAPRWLRLVRNSTKFWFAAGLLTGAAGMYYSMTRHLVRFR
jgi:hypothetical protein